MPRARAELPNPADVIVLPALFSDSPEPHVSSELLQRILFDGPWEGGTFVDFFREASRGRVSPGGAVAPWVRTDVTLLEAAGSVEGHGWIGARRNDYVIQAVRLADPFVDYTQYDNDGPDGVPNSGDDDGFIDALVVEFLEVAGSCGGPGIWPHFSSVREGGESGAATADIGVDGTPIRAYTYLTQSATDCTGVEPQGPNVIAHEYGHRLGLPDWYQAVEGIEPWKRHWNVGCFGLMGAGSWGCGSGVKLDNFGPVHPTAYSKIVLGWMETEVVTEVFEQEYVLEPAQTTGRALEIPLDASGEETLYVEYRPRIGFDHWLPAGGVLVYHWDEDPGARDVPAGLPPAKKLHVIEADGDHALRKVEAEGGNRGEETDVFGIDGRVGPYSSEVGPVRLYRHGGQPVSVTLHSVEVEGDVARVVISASAFPAVMAAEPGEGLRALESGTLGQLRVAGGAMPYTVVDADPWADFQGIVVGNEVRLEGTPLNVGQVELSFRIEDALGAATAGTLTIDVEDADIDLETLVDAVASVAGGGSEEADYLDGQGNRNGRPDVGDLRAFLVRKGFLQ
jgi:M6 family metalloprotease-like protein